MDRRANCAVGADGKLMPILSVQYLRGFAALAVVAFHAFEATPTKFSVGAAGVDVFFVISGFIMWTLTERAEASPASFVWRRLIRVAPPYWLATLIVVAIAAARPNFMWMPPPTGERILQSLLFVRHLDGWGKPHPVLTQGWTLNYEMYFYAVFAAVLFAPRRAQFLLLAGFLAGLMAAGLMLQPASVIANTYSSLLLAEFLAGVCLGRLWLAGRLKTKRGGALLVFVGLGAFAVEHWLGVREGPWRAASWGMPAVVLVAGGLCLEGAGCIKRWRIPKTLGDASYSIYLFHVVVVALGFRVFGNGHNVLRVLGTLVASAGVGVVLFHLLERPVTNGLRRLTTARTVARTSTLPALGSEPG